MKSTKRTTILALGTNLSVLDTSVRAAIKTFNSDRFVVIHNNVNRKELHRISSHFKSVYRNLNITWSNTGYSDLHTIEQNRFFFEKVISLIKKVKHDSDDISVSITGGRKTMSSLLLAASTLTGIDNVYHSLVPNDWENKMQVPFELITVIRMPALKFHKLLQHIINDIDENGLYKGSIFNFVEQLSSDQAFNKLNTYLDQLAFRRKLKEQYLAAVPFFQKMTDAVNLILKNLFIEGQLMYLPVYESRIKDFTSLMKKIEGRSTEETIADPFKRFSDLVGVRLIFYNNLDLQKAKNILIKSSDFIDAKTGGKPRPDDKGKKMGNGYRAIHFDVKLNPEKRGHLPEYISIADISCEIQFKTIFAHAWSQVHHAIVYKQNKEQYKSQIKQQELDDDFRLAASKLEDIETSITLLCSKFYPKNYKNKIK